MTAFDRRTFLGHSAKTSAVLAGAAALPAATAATLWADPAVAGADSPALESMMRVTGLTVTGAVNPIGVDPDAVVFAWKLTAPGRLAKQAAYQIALHRTDAGHSGQVWNSGKVASARQAFIYYSGPSLQSDAAYAWTVRVLDGNGDWTPTSGRATFVTALRETDWVAQWLQPQAASAQLDRVTYLRRQVSVPAGVLVRATAYVAAAHTYQLFVNGRLKDRGPSFCFPDEQYFRCVDVTSALQPGRHNLLGVLHHWYGPGKGRPLSYPGLLVEVALHYADGRVVRIGTDGEWTELPAEWLPAPLRNNDVMDFVEWVDSRAHPVGWNQVGYDDSSWTPARVLGPAGTAPFTHTFVQRTSFDERVIEPVAVRTLSNGSIVADFGAIYAARIQLTFPEGESGWTVPMHLGFALDPDGQVSTVHDTQETNLSYSYILRDGEQVFEPLCYLGFRYLQIDNPPGALGRTQIAAVTTHAAMPEVPMATFTTSERMLNSVWKLNARSCLLCCHEQFVDTPTRSKGQFLWDSANESEAIMWTYGDQNMSWQGLRDALRGQLRYHPEGGMNEVYPNGNGLSTIDTFTERYPEWVWRYYTATGDLDTVVFLYPSLVRVTDYLWNARNSVTGLLEGLADVPMGDPTYGYDTNVVADTASNVLAVNAFNRVAQLAGVAGDAAGAAVQSSRAQQLTGAVNGVLFSAGVYVDGVRSNGSLSTHASQEANALALAYGLVPANMVAGVGAYVASQGIAVGPNHGLELLRGLAVAELWDDIVRLLTDTKIPGWAHIVAEGGSFCWETWTPSDLIGDSKSHGWGSSALVAMGESLLGVTLQQPGSDGTVRAAISPPRTGLAHAAGSLPTVAGRLSVSWTRRASTISLQTTIPTNATATVALPAANSSSVRESGAAYGPQSGVTSGTFSNGMAYLTIGSGTYQFTSTLT
jgi:alpha-L-rhamnosidase